MKFKILIFLSIFFVGCNSVKNANHITQKEHSKQYDIMVENLNNDHKDFNYLKFRKLYTKTTNYKPYTLDTFSIKRKINNAINNQDYSQCVKSANKWLELNHTSINAHAEKSFCCKKQKLKECEHKHASIVNGLLDSIVNSGDGRTPSTAYETFNTDEIYFFMHVYGLKRVSQALSDKDGRAYDVMEVESIKSGKPFTIYFDVTTQITNKNDSF